MTFQTHQAMLVVKDFLNIYSLTADVPQCFAESRNLKQTLGVPCQFTITLSSAQLVWLHKKGI